MKRTFFAVLFAFLSAELALQGHERNATIAMMQGAVVALIALWWLIEDSRQRQFLVSPLFKIGVVALSGLFIPVYLIRSRGIRAAFKSMSIFILQLFAIMLAASFFLTVLGKLGVVPVS